MIYNSIIYCTVYYVVNNVWHSVGFQTGNYFCFVFFLLNMSIDECQNLPTKKERLKLAVNKWKALSPDECNIWKEKAKALTGNDISKLTETQKKRQISKAKKQVASQVLLHIICYQTSTYQGSIMVI